MNERARQAKNAYQNKWRAEHKERVKEYNARYWERKAASTDEEKRAVNA